MTAVSYWYSVFFARMPFPVRVLLNLLMLPIAIVGAVRTAVRSMREDSLIFRMEPEELAQIFTFDSQAGNPDQIAAADHQAQFIALCRSEAWDDVAAYLETHDRARTVLPSGRRLAPYLAHCLWQHLVKIAAPQVDLSDPENIDPDDVPDSVLTPIHAAAEDAGASYGVHALAAAAQLRLAWLRRGSEYADFSRPEALARFGVHLDAAHARIADLDAEALDAPLLASLQFQARIGSNIETPALRQLHKRWMALDPGNMEALATLGFHLLPRWYGDYEVLAEAAQEAFATSHDRTGTAAYAAVYLGAVRCDTEALLTLDMPRFREGLIDMVCHAPDPDVMCNLICAQLQGMSVPTSSIAGNTASPDVLTRFAEVKALAAEFIRRGIGVVMPDVWAEWFDEDDLPYMLAEVFEAELMVGATVHLGPTGAEITLPEPA